MFNISTFDQEPYIKLHFNFINESALAERLLFLDENFLQINQNKHQEVANNLRRLVSYTGKCPVLCLDSNPIGVEQYMSDLSLYYDIDDVFVLLWNANDSKILPQNQAYWPTFLINQRIENTKVSVAQPREHRISFLSGLVRYHRIKLWTEICSLTRDQDVVVANSICLPMFDNTIPIGAEKDAEILKQQITLLPWANKQKYIDQDQTGWINNTGGIDHPAYLSCVNITGESWYHSQDIFVTEKTWKAYRAGCLVVNYGAERITDYLKKLGFAIWEEYDTTGNMQQRLVLIKELFQRDDIEALYRQNSDMIQHNLNLFHNDALAQLLCRPAVEKLKNWVV